MTQDYDFHGKAALITGASSGIGAATAITFAKNKANLFLVGRNERRLSEIVEQCRLFGVTAEFGLFDVANPSDVQKACDEAISAFGRIDSLITSAGIYLPNSMGEVDQQSLDRVRTVLDVDLLGTFYFVNSMIPHLIKNGGGTIVTVSSVAGGLVGFPHGSVYAMAKAAIVALTRSVAAECGKHGVRINCVAPGNTRTPINEATRAPENKHIEEMFQLATPSGRVWSEPEDIANVISFLASDLSVALHGDVLLACEGLGLAMPPVPETTK